MSCTPTAALTYEGSLVVKEEQRFSSQVSSATTSGTLVPATAAISSRLIYNGELPIPDNLTEHMLEVRTKSCRLVCGGIC